MVKEKSELKQKNETKSMSSENRDKIAINFIILTGLVKTTTSEK